MDFSAYFPFWNNLTQSQQKLILDNTTKRVAKKGELLNHGSSDCVGLLLVQSGLLRAYVLSGEGQEVTLYRLIPNDICLFSASCIMKNIQFEVLIEAEKESIVWVIPSEIYQTLMETSLLVANYTNQMMAARFSQVIWLMEQIMWNRFDKRLAHFLLEEARLNETHTLKLTHEAIANHMGTAREVVTRMLHYFQNEGMVQLTRGTVVLSDETKLQNIVDAK